VAQLVRKGAGAELANSSEVVQAKDFRGVLDIWAQDIVKSYKEIKTK
jgi:hypothetical protein